MRSFFMAATAACFFSAPASALVVLSGDMNILNPLDEAGLGGSLSDVNPGNQTLFRNILGDGSSVLIFGNEGSTSFTRGVTAAVNFFDSLAGVTATSDLSGGPLTASAIDDVSLFVSLNAGAYDATETALLQNFRTAGGKIMVLGENRGVRGFNDGINDLMSALGSDLSISPANIGSGFQTTTNVFGPLAVGVSSLTYAAVSRVSGGTTLAQTGGEFGLPFIAYDFLSTTPPAAQIPVPASAALLLAALGGIGLVRARRA